MRKLVLTGLTLTIVLAVAGIAIAQYATPTVTITEAKVTPSKAGTKTKAKSGFIHSKFVVPSNSNATLRRIEYTFDKGIKIDTKGFKACSLNQVAADDSKCPKGSQVGTGSSTAEVGPGHSPLNFTAKVFYSGGKAITLHLTNTANPALAPAFPGQISGQKIGFDIPEGVQQPVKGLYSYVTSVTADLGKQPGVSNKATVGKGKKKKTHYFVSIIGCKGKKHTLGAKAFFTNNPNPPAVQTASDTQAVPCKA